jgi:peptide/nickel transport system permease protein
VSEAFDASTEGVAASAASVAGGYATTVPATARPLVTMLRQAATLWRTRIGLVAVGILAAIAIIGPFVAPHSATEFAGAPNRLPAASYLLGTDYLGRDVLSRFLSGGGSILAVAALATALGILLGVAVGLVAASARHLVDETLMRGMDVILAFPQVMWALVAISMLGASAWLVVVIVGLTTMPRIARVTRAAALGVIERDFVRAAQAMGVPRRKVLIGEVLPNIVSPLMVEATLRLTYAIGIIATLAFLGFTPNPSAANWGLMIQENEAAVTQQPWAVVTPMLAIALLTIGAGLIGDGLSRASIGLARGRTSR